MNMVKSEGGAGSSSAGEVPDSVAFRNRKESAVATDATSVHSNKKRYLFVAAALWIGMLMLAKSLQSSGLVEGVADQNFFEEFLSITGWNNFNLTSTDRQINRPGFLLAQEGAQAKYPLVIVPGFSTSGLEVWEGKSCAQSKFRQRMWGGIGTARGLIAEQDCWREHMALDPLTGVDPEGIRLRAAQGFEAADYFMANYWVWGKLIESLADVGYDGTSMYMASYDWRLAFTLVEKRDGYFTRLRHTIEAMHKTQGRKVVLASHSMGSQLLLYFFAWVTADERNGGGGGGPKWVDEHVHAYVNIAGPMLGVPKAACALLSGELRDTSHFIGVLGSMMETFFARRRRKDLWNTWGSLWGMLPQGGDSIWGIGADLCSSASTCGALRCNLTETCDAQPVAPLMQLTDTAERILSEPGTCQLDEVSGRKSRQNTYKNLNTLIDEFSQRTSHSTAQVLQFLHDWGGGYGPATVNSKLHSINYNEKPSPRTWSDPSRTPLPPAPRLDVYCLYGVGLPTERAYFYRQNTERNIKTCNDTYFEPPLVMDTTVDEPENDIYHGVKFVDGDGTVPLLSSGYLCVDGWKRKELNPSGAKVVTREYPDAKEFQVDDPTRGGPHAADHVDILGNVDLMRDFLRIVTDFDVKNVKTDIIVSDIENISKRINSHPNGGLHVRNSLLSKIGIKT
jgi:phospholipid:diacylglycerol acyltransferase